MPMRRCFMFCGLFILNSLIPTASAEEPKRDANRLNERSQAVKGRIDAEYGSLVTLYKHIHTHPELSRFEVTTAAKLAQEMSAIGFEVTTKVGGTGLVCLYRNGDGPT